MLVKQVVPIDIKPLPALFHKATSFVHALRRATPFGLITGHKFHLGVRVIGLKMRPHAEANPLPMLHVFKQIKSFWACTSVPCSLYMIRKAQAISTVTGSHQGFCSGGRLLSVQIKLATALKMTLPTGASL